MSRIGRIVVIGAAGLLGLAALGPSSGDAGPSTAAVISLGDVRFPHEFHFEELGVECRQCHHETEAAKLDIPHAEYFEDFWIDCETCHHVQRSPGQPQECSDCHHANPFDIADETLSAKVVIHRSCWACHDVGTGKEAAKSCASCHSGKRPNEAGAPASVP